MIRILIILLLFKAIGVINNNDFIRKYSFMIFVPKIGRIIYDIIRDINATICGGLKK